MTLAPKTSLPRKMAKFAPAVLVAGSLPALAAGLPPDIAKVAKDYDRATIHSDVPTLARLFADDYMLVNSDASVENKQQALADFLMPGFRIDPYVMEQTTEIAWNDAAVISGLVNLSWTQDGKHQTRRLRIAHVWAKRAVDVNPMLAHVQSLYRLVQKDRDVPAHRENPSSSTGKPPAAKPRPPEII